MNRFYHGEYFDRGEMALQKILFVVVETPNKSKEWLWSIRINLWNYASNKYLNFKNWYHKPAPALDTKYTKIVMIFNRDLERKKSSKGSKNWSS